MSTPESRLALLACPLDQNSVGTAWLYPLPEKVDGAWFALRERYYGITGSKANLPYAGLLTVLRASGHTSASLYPCSKENPPRYLALSRQLDASHLRNVIALWEQALLLTPRDDITLNYPSELADLISSVQPEQVALWDRIRRGDTCVDAQGWVFDAANWNLTQKLAGTPLEIDGRKISLRADTENNLLAWEPEHLWQSTWQAARPDKDENTEPKPSEPEEWKTLTRYAALRVQVAMKSLPGRGVPLAVLFPTTSRLSNTLRGARSAWLAPKAPGAPLLSLQLSGKGDYTHLDHTSRLALDAWVRLRDERIFPRRPEEKEFLSPSAMDLSGTPGNLRALIPYSVSFPIGKGVGLHTVSALARHASTALGQPLLGARRVPGVLVAHSRTTEFGRDTTLLDDADLPHILQTTGVSKLRILALYRHQTMRTRMQRLLAYHFNRPELARGMPDEEVIELTSTTEVVFTHAPELLAHGDHHASRAALTDQLPHLNPPPGTGVLALCETEYDQRAWARQRRESRAKNATVQDPYVLDAKPHVSKHLAKNGVLAQFLKPISKPLRSKKKPIETATPLQVLGSELAADFPGHMAVADMLRASGLVHPRLSRAISFGPRGLKTPMAHVGLHLRLQLGERRGPLTDPPKLMWTLVAFIPDGDRWRVLAHLPTAPDERGGWLDYAQAQCIYRSGPIPEGRRQDAALPRRIDQALHELRQHTTVDYVLYVSGNSSRSLWPRLANKNLDIEPDGNGYVDGKPALPGLTLPAGFRPRSIIRITTGGPDLPIPAFLEAIYPDGEATEGDKTSNALFRVEDTNSTFILSNRPHQMDGKTFYAKAGRNQSRWNCTDPVEQAETWYSLTSTEIAVLHLPPGDDPTPYALTAARLCNHPLAWEHRTQYPLPIHAGIQMDKDHPQYRRTIDWNAGEDGS